MFQILLNTVRKFGFADVVTKEIVKVALLKVINEVFAHDDEIIRVLTYRINDIAEKFRDLLVKKVTQI